MKKNKNPIQKIERFLFLSLAAGFLIFQVACSKSSGGRGSNVIAPIRPVLPIGANPNCSNCVGAPAMLVATDSSSGLGSVLMSLDIYGDISGGVSFQDPKAPLKYQGPIQAVGVFAVQVTDSMSCYAPIGQYEIQTLQAGVWRQGVVGGAGYGPGGMKMVAMGPGGIQITLSLAQGIIYNNTSMYGTNNQEVNRLGGTLIVESVGNTPCGSRVELM